MSYDSIFRPGLFDGQTIIVTGGGGGRGPGPPPPRGGPGAPLVVVGPHADNLENNPGEILHDGR
ncbi:2,4-dienoyl-CoA reductase, partial [Pseudomonas aeruginosa]